MEGNETCDTDNGKGGQLTLIIRNIKIDFSKLWMPKNGGTKGKKKWLRMNLTHFALYSTTADSDTQTKEKIVCIKLQIIIVEMCTYLLYK